MLLIIGSTILVACIIRSIWLSYRPISFSGKTVWITGASSGIGEYLAYEFHRLGAFVILSGRNEIELERVHSALKNSEIFKFDLSDSSTVVQNSKQILNKHKVDILINNAGISQRSFFCDTLDNINNERTLMEINYFSVVGLTKAFVKSLEGRAGTVVVVSSTAGMLPAIPASGYAASKCGIIGYYEAISAELKELSVNVVILAPGFISTNLTMNALDSKGKKLGILDPRNKNGIKPEDFARIAVRGIANGEKKILVTQKLILLFYYIRSIFPTFSSLLIRRMALKVAKNILKKDS